MTVVHSVVVADVVMVVATEETAAADVVKVEADAVKVEALADSVIFQANAVKIVEAAAPEDAVKVAKDADAARKNRLNVKRSKNKGGDLSFYSFFIGNSRMEEVISYKL